MGQCARKILAVMLSAVMCVSLLPAQNAAAADGQGVIFTEAQDNFVGNYGAERSSLFNDNWKFNLGKSSGADAANFNDASWKTVNLPHDFSISQGFTVSGEAESGFLPGGTGWYRKKFTLPASCQGKSIVLNFDGVYSHATVYVNGTKVGENHYGYTSFAFDITDYVTCDDATENVVAVEAVNNVPSSRWYSGSGIYRDVKLIITDPVHVALNGTYVTTPDIASGKGTVNVAVDVQNDGGSSANVTVRNTVYEKGGQEALANAQATVTVSAGEKATVNANPVVSSPKLWSLDTPNLYFVRTEILKNGTAVDTYDTEFGFKWYEFVDNTGFRLNGQNVKIQGVCMHHDQGALGSAAYYDAMYRQLTILKDMGVNTIRATHNPYDEDFVDICNELGMLVIEEAFDGWSCAKNGNSNDFSTHFKTNLTSDNQIIDGSSSMTWAEFVIKAMVKRDRNDPSIILWSLGNEITEGVGGAYTGDYGTISTNLIQWVKETDTVHPVTSGDNQRSTSGVTGQVGSNIYNAGGVVGFNYGDISAIDSLHSTYPVLLYSETASATNSRGIYTSQNSNSDADGKLHLTSYDTSTVGWGKTAHASMWNVMTRDYIAGECVWTGFDYIGEPTPWNGTGTGSVSYQGAVPNSSYFGIIDTTGFPKDTYYLYRSQWNKKENTLHLVTAWDSDNMMTSSGKTPVWVYSNAARVDLYRDNTKIGTATRKVNTTAAGHVYYTYTTTSNNSSICTTTSGSGDSSLYSVFNVTYTSGTISAKAYNENGVEITDTCQGNTSVTTPGTVSKLKVSQDKKEILADGSSLAYISVDVTDASDHLDTTAANDIVFTLSGNGEIVGVDNGDQATTDKYQQSSVLTSATSAHIKAFAGKALAIVRSTKDAGNITVNVSSSGLTGGTVTIRAKQVEQGKTDGIASYRMSKHCYVPAGTDSISLPATVTATYADGSTAELPVNWDTYDVSKLNTPGEFIVNGRISDGTENIDVFLTIHVYDEIAGAENYSAVTQPGSVPVLPGTAMTYYADGTAFEEFAVHWNMAGITSASFANEGDVVTVNGTVSALGGTYPVTANIRVASPVAGELENVAPAASSLTESCSPVSDSLESIVNGVKYSGLDDTGQRWTNWHDKTTKTSPVITFKWDTAHTVAEIRMYYYHNANGNGEPESVTFYYSLDGTNYSEIGHASPVTIPNESGKVENGYIYTLDAPVNPVAMQIELKQNTTATGNNAFVGVTEAEIMATSYTYPANSSALLDGISTGGKEIPGFDPEVKAYDVESFDDITVTNSKNAAVTILPAKNNRVKILTISEDGSASEVYTLNLETSEEQLTAAARQRLETAIAKAGEKDASLYTDASYASMQTAKEAAQAVLDRQGAARTEIENALTALQNAVNSLEVKPEDNTEILSQLRSAVEEADAKIESEYTATSYITMKTALENARKVLDNEKASKTEIEEALSDLRNAINGLQKEQKPEPDDNTEILRQLGEAVAEAEAKDPSKYTEDTYARLEEALTAARKVIGTTEPAADPTKEEIQKALKELRDALDSLQLKKEDENKEIKEELNSAVEDAGKAEESKYTEASYKTMQDALKIANAVLAKENATKEEIEEALANLQEAIEGLKTKEETEKPAVGKDPLPSGTEETPKDEKEPDVPSDTANPPVSDPDAGLPKEGSSHIVSGAVYKITVSERTGGTVTFMKPEKKNLKKLTIPASVTIDGISFKVTAVAANACKNCKKLKKVTIGKYVTQIGKSAFAGDKSLKSIVIKSKVLKKVGKSALKNIHAKCRIKVGKKQFKKYSKLLKKKGQKATVKIVS